MTMRTIVNDYRNALRRPMNVEFLDHTTRHLLHRLFPTFARAALFVIYTWFGAIKLIGLSPATPLAEALTRHTIGTQYFGLSFALTAVFECVIGVLFLIPAATRVVIPLLVVHLAVVCSPLLLVPELAWTAPLVPSLEGQYIIKNLAIIALAIGVAARMRPTAAPAPA